MTMRKTAGRSLAGASAVATAALFAAAAGPAGAADRGRDDDRVGTGRYVGTGHYKGDVFRATGPHGGRAVVVGKPAHVRHPGRTVVVKHPIHRPVYGGRTVIVKRHGFYGHPGYYWGPSRTVIVDRRRHYDDFGRAVAVGAGVVAGAVLLDAVIDANAARARPVPVNYGYSGAVPVTYPAAPPQPAPQPYFEDNTAPPASATAGAPGSYERAYTDCAARARAVSAQQGAYRSYVTNVTEVRQDVDGAWAIEGFLAAERANGSFARRFFCTADAAGVRTLEVN